MIGWCMFDEDRRHGINSGRMLGDEEGESQEAIKIYEESCAQNDGLGGGEG